jgi:hypothetical protein
MSEAPTLKKQKVASDMPAVDAKVYEDGDATMSVSADGVRLPDLTVPIQGRRLRLPLQIAG